MNVNVVRGPDADDFRHNLSPDRHLYLVGGEWLAEGDTLTISISGIDEIPRGWISLATDEKVKRVKVTGIVIGGLETTGG